MTKGVTTTNVDRANLLDTFLGNRAGTTSIVAPNDVAAQLIHGTAAGTDVIKRIDDLSQAQGAGYLAFDTLAAANAFAVANGLGPNDANRYVARVFADGTRNGFYRWDGARWNGPHSVVDPGSILPSGLTERDMTNAYPDSNMEDTSLYAGSVTVGRWSGGGAAANYIALAGTVAASQMSSAVWPVTGGVSYALAGMFGKYALDAGDMTARLFVDWFSDVNAAVFISSDQIGREFTATNGNSRTQVSADISAPAAARRARFRLVKDASATIIRALWTNLSVRLAIAPAPLSQTDVNRAAGPASAFAFDPSTGETLFALRSDNPIVPASLTKMLTAVTALRIADQFDLDLSFVFTLDATDQVGGSGAFLKPGDQISFNDALADIFLASSNEASVMVARTLGQLLVDSDGVGQALPRFLSQMNAVAREIGMARSAFINASGLPAGGQITTARDMSRLVYASMQEHRIAAVWNLPAYDIVIAGPDPRTVTVTRSIPDDADILGGKTGTITPRDYHLAVVADVAPMLQPPIRPVVVVVMHAASDAGRKLALRTLIDAIRSGFGWHEAGADEIAPKAITNAKFADIEVASSWNAINSTGWYRSANEPPPESPIVRGNLLLQHIEGLSPRAAQTCFDTISNRQ
ncbi:D-alanyl-D-alanine carboxypeptidase family protein [Brucella anthropi]|uniref:D-alanyl-D-alanine carboxypeptidase family protein n=1 Tax=Brucella anthropi TaxID=529 RepID=UPI00384F0B8F